MIFNLPGGRRLSSQSSGTMSHLLHRTHDALQRCFILATAEWHLEIHLNIQIISTGPTGLDLCVYPCLSIFVYTVQDVQVYDKCRITHVCVYVMLFVVYLSVVWVNN